MIQEESSIRSERATNECGAEHRCGKIGAEL